MAAKEFPIEDVLTLITGVYICNSPTGSSKPIGSIIHHVTGYSDVRWFQYERARAAIGDALREQLPKEARNLQKKDLDQMVQSFMDSHGAGARDALTKHLQTKYGATVALSPVKGYKHKDPRSEWVDKNIRFVYSKSLD